MFFKSKECSHVYGNLVEEIPGRKYRLIPSKAFIIKKHKK